jgi:hypothetical protein
VQVNRDGSNKGSDSDSWNSYSINKQCTLKPASVIWPRENASSVQKGYNRGKMRLNPKVL